MMLLYKAWRESRGRFLTGAIVLAGYCVLTIAFWHDIQKPFSFPMMGNSYREYVDRLVLGGMGKMAFVVPIIFLGLGGLLRERAHHTAVFTLALPVSRAQLVGAQIAVALAETALLAFLPTVLIHPLSLLVHQSYAVADVFRLCLLRFLCGTEILGISYFLSVLLRGEYTAPIACYLALFVQAQAASWARLLPHDLNPLRIMDARWAWYGGAPDFTGPLPWMDLSILMLIALVLFAAATRITERQNL